MAVKGLGKERHTKNLRWGRGSCLEAEESRHKRQERQRQVFQKKKKKWSLGLINPAESAGRIEARVLSSELVQKEQRLRDALRGGAGGQW